MVSEGRTPNLPAAPAALATATASARHAPLLPPLENRAPRSPALFPLKTRRSPFWLLAPTAFPSHKNATPARSREGTNWDIPASFLRLCSRKVSGVRHRAPCAKPSSPHSFETRTSRLRPPPDPLHRTSSADIGPRREEPSWIHPIPSPRAHPSKGAAPFSTWFSPSCC